MTWCMTVQYARATILILALLGASDATSARAGIRTNPTRARFLSGSYSTPPM